MSIVVQSDGGSVRKLTDDRIGDVMWEHPNWGLVYWDDYVMIFLKRGSASPAHTSTAASYANPS